MRQVAHLRDRLAHVVLHLVEQRRDGRTRPADGAVAEQVAGQAEVDRQRDQVLLRAVVDVALDPAPLGVGGRDQA